MIDTAVAKFILFQHQQKTKKKSSDNLHVLSVCRAEGEKEVVAFIFG